MPLGALVCFISNCHSLIVVFVEKQKIMLFTLTIYSYATIAWVWLFLEFTSRLSNISRQKSRKFLISKVQVARPGIELQTPASHELKHSTTSTPFSTIALDKRSVNDIMKHTMRQKEKERDLTQ